MWDLVSWSGIESGPLHWEHGVLATALQGKSLFFFLNCFSFVSAFPHLLLHVGEIFNCNIFKIFLIPFLFLFFFWDPYNSSVVMSDIFPEVILSSFHSFYFILLFRSYFHHFIFQLTDSFFCFRYSAIDSF